MQILITGGAGFIGSHLAQFYLRRGDTVEIVDDLSGGLCHNMASFQYSPRLSFRQANVLSWKGLDDAVGRSQRIYHMAAMTGAFRVLQQPVEVLHANTASVDRVLRAIVRVGHGQEVVLPSFPLLRGATARMREDDPLLVATGHLQHPALGKLVNEAQACAYHKEHGVRVVIARLFDVVGPRQSGLHGFVLPRFVQQALSNSPITVFGSGLQRRSFCDVRDAVGMLHGLASCKQAYGQVVNVGADQEMSILDLARKVKELTASSSPIEFIANEDAYGQPYAQVDRLPALDRVHELIQYRPRWTLDETIMAVCEHYRGLPEPVAQRHATQALAPSWPAPLHAVSQLSGMGAGVPV